MPERQSAEAQGGRRAPTFRPEAWSELAGKDWSYWDLWFSVVAVLDHAGSLDDIEARLVAGLRDHRGGREGAESKLSHLADLRARLADAGLTPADLAPARLLADRSVVSRARKKVADRWLEGRAMTPAMIDTPRARLLRRARHGHWDAFRRTPASSTAHSAAAWR